MSKQQTEEPQAITLDFGNFGSQLTEALKDQQKELAKTITESLKPAAPANGKGILLTEAQQKQQSALIEKFHNIGTNGENWKLEEQWTVVIPVYRTHETSANLRDYVYVSEILKQEPGDYVNIPYVSDVSFEILGAVGNAFSATWAEASLVSVLTTTLYEAGGYADIAYATIEKINQNLLDEINSVLAVASVRAEDKQIIKLVEALTSTNFAGNITRNTGSASFYSTNIPAALKLLLRQGKKVRPTDVVMYLSPDAYGALLSEIVSSQVFAFAAPNLINQGVVEKLIGVGLVVGGYTSRKCRAAAATGTVDVCYMMRGPRAIALAPKRELLVETQKQIATRKLRITASHTFGVKILDGKEIVRIWTSNKTTPATSQQ